MAGLIVQEWIENRGGAEKVVAQMVEALPGAAVVALWDDTDGAALDVPVAETVLARTPLRRSKAAALPLMPIVWRRLDLNPTPDWLLSSSHAFAHHARLRGAPEVPRYAYVHSPARYLWSPEHDGRGAHPAIQALGAPLRAIDRVRAQEPGQVFAANSAFVRERIEAAWGVPAEVIYPPVDIDRFARAEPVLEHGEELILERLPGEFILGASRWVPYKGMDKIIRMGHALGIPTVIAGGGPEDERLVALAADLGAPTVFVRHPSDGLLEEFYRRAIAFVFPPVEDFGIMPVEAMAAGCRVIVNAAGGTAESVVDGTTGVHVEDFDDVSALRAAVDRLERIDRAALPGYATRFSPERFREGLRRWMGLA
ncbi:glycosyltransferase [Demequina mangrovi]|uniref:Glycosyltransferase involved in cell wall bisynthesis n=1 Tax=Demequina mangrovi TaxID=1043493 RepID=A0A1H6YSU8_9MICO|nr:glycosyltransferase [Demequina mangrovi]SEJ40342.1 Glycosyltransferase involved in cell wall bisynthesis [Demequina mangrovi]